jgi:hypothetical protein
MPPVHKRLHIHLDTTGGQDPTLSGQGREGGGDGVEGVDGEGQELD